MLSKETPSSAQLQPEHFTVFAKPVELLTTLLLSPSLDRDPGSHTLGKPHHQEMGSAFCPPRSKGEPSSLEGRQGEI